MTADSPDHEGGAPPNPQLTLHDRRRPGRILKPSPDLIPLLRNPSEIDPASIDPDTMPASSDEDDNLRPARGILIGAAISVLIWAVLITLVWWVV